VLTLKHFYLLFTSTPSAYDVITVNALYKLLTYLLTSRWQECFMSPCHRMWSK